MTWALRQRILHNLQSPSQPLSSSAKPKRLQRLQHDLQRLPSSKIAWHFMTAMGTTIYCFLFVYEQGSCRIIQQVHTSDLKSWIKSLPRELRQAIRVRSISTSFRMWCLFVTLLQNKLSTALHWSLESHLQTASSSMLLCCYMLSTCFLILLPTNFYFVSGRYMDHQRIDLKLV